jgi:hypothetical protein
MRKSMSDRGVAAIRPRAARYAVPDPELRGHWIRIQPSGSKSFWTVTRNPQGKQVWTLLGPTDMGIEQSREKARLILARVRDGLPAFEPKADSFGKVTADRRLADAPRQGKGAAVEGRGDAPAQRARSTGLEGSRVHLDPQERRRGPSG